MLYAELGYMFFKTQKFLEDAGNYVTSPYLYLYTNVPGNIFIS